MPANRPNQRKTRPRKTRPQKIEANKIESQKTAPPKTEPPKTKSRKTQQRRKPPNRDTPGTARRNVYRLTVEPTAKTMTAAILADPATVQATERAGCLVVTAASRRFCEEVSWKDNYVRLTGVDAVLHSSNPFAVVLIAVDGTVYAVTFGAAAHLLDPGAVDSGFGLRFGARVLNPDQISEMISNVLTGKSRVDSTIIAGGAPISAFGSPMQGNLVRKLAGRPYGFTLPTAGRRSTRQPTRIVGADYLSITLGTAAEDMVADLREISKTWQTSRPDPRLEWTSWIRRLDQRADAALITQLDLQLGQELGDHATGVEFAIPVNTLPMYDDIVSYKVRAARTTRKLPADLDLEDLIDEVRLLNPEDRVPLLRRGWVEPCGDRDGDEPIAPKTPAISWISCEITIDSDVYVLIEGGWYRIGTAHLEGVKRQVDEILDRSAGITLPAWPRTTAREEDYLRKTVAAQATHLLVMDQVQITDAHHRQHGIEACDLLDHKDEAVYHVKKAKQSSPLSHLFAQAVVAHDACHGESRSRANFAKQVELHHKQAIDPAFRPKKVILAIKWKDGERLTSATMPTFAQIALLYTVYALRGVDVYVISIDAV